MIKKLLFPIVLIAIVVLGGVGADFLRNKVAGGGAEKQGEAAADHGKKEKKAKGDHSKKDEGDHGGKKEKKKKKKKKGGHGEEDSGDSGGAMTFMSFKRQFVVPVMTHGEIQSLVLLNLNLELNESAPENPYMMEPKLRDAIMRALLTLSHDGVLSQDLTSAQTYDEIQEALLDATKTVLSDSIENVLILDLSKQAQ